MPAVPPSPVAALTRSLACACACRTAPYARTRTGAYVLVYIVRPELTAQLQVQLAAAGISLSRDVKLRVFFTKTGRSMASLDFTDATMRALACQVVPGLRPDVKEGAIRSVPIR